MMNEKYSKPRRKKQFLIDFQGVCGYNPSGREPVERTMDTQLGQYSRMGLFLAIFMPDFKLDKCEFSKENADRLIDGLIRVLDALFKAENLSRRKNFRLPGGRTFFPGDRLAVLDNAISYLQAF